MASRKTTKTNAQQRQQLANQRAAGLAASIPAHLQSTVNDVCGVALLAMAIGMVVAVLVPSTAPVTHVTAEVLELLFGRGALLLPLALMLFAFTFFTKAQESMSLRTAIGLILIVTAFLSVASISYPGAAEDASLVISQACLRERGGYVGGGVAWALLSTLGFSVGIVALVALAVAGLVICGFSVSNALERLFARALDARGAIQERIETRREMRRVREEYAQRSPSLEDDTRTTTQMRLQAIDGAPASEPATSYLGTRTTTVLRRHNQPELGFANPLDPVDGDGADGQAGSGMGAAVARLLRRAQSGGQERRAQIRRATLLDEQVEPEMPEPHPMDTPDVPVTMKRPAAVALEEEPKRTKRGSKRRKVASSQARGSRREIAPRPGEGDENYSLPPLSMLSSNPQSAQSASTKREIEETMDRLQGTLREFGLSSRVVDYVSGPLVTTFRVEMGEGERVNRIRSLEDDIALTLAAEKVRIFAPIPGTSYVGIEIPNQTRQSVHLGDVLPDATGGPLEVAIGRDSSGKPIIADIAQMPHMLVAGTTGSGKSVLINSMIMSLLMRATPKQVRLIMVDPKRVEFKDYNGIPHLYVPVVTEPRQAASALQWAVSEMERRLKVFERAGARNITVYNDMCVNGKLSQLDNPPEPMPYLVIVIDELADLMMVAGKDVEASIVRIAQLARAAGIHLVIATQRPSANVVTGLIKSNIDSRVALKVSSGVDSRVILDETGADRLLGNGDMLFKDRGLAPKRVLGCFTPDAEIESVVDFIRSQGEPEYHEEILSAVVPGQPGVGGSVDDEEDDPLVWEAARIVVESQLGSTSGLQRRLKVGYARAGRIMDMLEAKGVVGPASGSKPREVLLDEEGLEDLRVQEERFREV